LDIEHWLKQLRTERARIAEVIGTVEALERSGIPTRPASRRGRKFMTADERLMVSERMRRYWEARRNKPSDLPVPNETARAQQYSR
jgi:hypothetical protein